MQKNLLPLYLESQRVVKRHQKCLSTILTENEDAIPRQLANIIDKGAEGLASYGQLL